MKSPPKIYAFIDSQNLNLGIQSCGWKLDFNRFFIYLKDKYRVDKAFLFIGYLAGNESLYTSLQRSGYIIIFKPTLEYKKQGKFFTKGNIDAELVLHAMIEYPYYDKAIIISGDGYFYCLIEYLEKMNKLSQIIIPHPKKYSALLKRFGKYFVYIYYLQKKLEYQKKRGINLRTKP